MLGVLFGVGSTIERLNKNQSSTDEIKFGHPMTVILFGVDSTIEQKITNQRRNTILQSITIILFGVD